MLDALQDRDRMIGALASATRRWGGGACLSRTAQPLIAVVLACLGCAGQRAQQQTLKENVPDASDASAMQDATAEELPRDGQAEMNETASSVDSSGGAQAVAKLGES